MAKIRLRKRERESIRIQVHAKIPVPMGYALAPELVTQLIDEWIDGDDPFPVEVKSVDWNFNDKRKGAIGPNASGEVDAAGDIRRNLLDRFRGGGVRTSFKDLGAGENEIGIESDDADFDD